MSTAPEPSALCQSLVQRKRYIEAEFLDIYEVPFMKNVLFSLLSENGREVSPLVQYAAKYAEDSLDGRFRKKGSVDGYQIPDVIHAYRVAIRLARAGITDDISMATALLHDVVEDTHITAQNIEDEFGKEFGAEVGLELATNVFFLSKNFDSKYTISVEGCYDRMRRASKTVRQVKYADRIDNLQSFQIMRDLNEDMGRGISVRESYWKNLDETEKYILRLRGGNRKLRRQLIDALDNGNSRLGRKNMFLRKAAVQVPAPVSRRR